MVSHGPLLQFALMAGCVLAIKLALLTAACEFPLRCWMADKSPGQRARIAWWMLVAPAVAGTFYAAMTIALPALLRDSEGFSAACATHSNSLLHLCIWHPSANDASTWLWMALAVLGGYAIWLAARAVAGLWRLHRKLTAMVKLSRLTDQSDGFHILAAEQPLALAFGLGRGHILLSTSLLERLDATQLRIVLAHEQAHVANRDVFFRLSAVVLSCLQLPATRRRLLRDLELAMEQRCDFAAAKRVDSPILVAETIVAVERMFRCKAQGHALLSMGFFSEFVSERVQALLTPQHDSNSRTGWVLATAVLSLSALSIGWLHHFTEFFIALLAG